MPHASLTQCGDRQMCTADSLGGLAYLGSAVEQLQRLDVSNNPMLRLHPGSESACQLSNAMHQHVYACALCPAYM